MGLYKEVDDARFKLGIWELTETLDELLTLLPDNGEMYTEELGSFKSEGRKLEWLAVRVLLYTLTGEVCTIQYHINGKPYFANSTVQLSISHTKGYVAVIVSADHEVGIDIEQMGDRVCRVAHKFMKEDELLLDSSLRTKGLLLIWSAKETIFKCMNEESVDFCEHIRVKVANLSFGWIVGRETRTVLKKTYLIHYVLDPKFVMTWTVC